MLYGWDGNCRSYVALAMHRGISTCGFNGLEKGDEHLACAPFGVLRYLLLADCLNE